MTESANQESKQAVTAERNAEAILDATERVLQAGKSATISAVSAESGVSRVTIYAHFKDRAGLLEAVVERTVRRVMAAIEPTEPERGPPIEALQRLVAASWEELARNSEIRRASAAELSADAMRRVHGSAHAVIHGLVERGRSDGSFRTDVPAGWLVTSLLTLIHAAADEARLGRLDADEALAALTLTVTDLFRGRG
jgi:AcrR family transcriptional regulator